MDRYGVRPNLAAIALMNEPRAPGVTLDALTKYYKAGYDAIRKYTNAYVILSARLGPADSKELFSLASTMNRVAIDVHYYSLFSDSFTGMTVQQNIDFVNNQRASDLGSLTSANGPLVLVGNLSFGTGLVLAICKCNRNEFGSGVFFCRGMDCRICSKRCIHGRLPEIC